MQRKNSEFPFPCYNCGIIILLACPLLHLWTCTTESLVSELKVSAPTERTVLSEVLSQVTCNRDHQGNWVKSVDREGQGTDRLCWNYLV